MKGKRESDTTLSDPMACNLLDSSVHGIFQARVLEWVASAFSILETTYFFNLFIWLCWVFVAACGLSLVVVCGLLIAVASLVD